MRRMIEGETGSMLVFLAVILPALIGVIALSVDMGHARWTRAHLRVAADAGALAGVRELVVTPSASSSQIQDLARAIFLTNAPRATLVDGGVEAGNWDWNAKTFSPGGSLNAVRITATDTSDNIFARIFDNRSVTVKVQSVAAFGGAACACIIPFGLGASMIDGRDYGDILNVNSGTQNGSTTPDSYNGTPGNWGKVDLFGRNEMSSGPNFIAAMTGDMCARSVHVGDKLSPGTGVAGLRTGFNERMIMNPIVIAPVVDSFQNGNATEVIIQGFVMLELLSQNGQGRKWDGRVRLLGEPASDCASGPSGAPYALAADLVL